MNPEVNAVIIELKTKINTLFKQYKTIEEERDNLVREKLDLLEQLEIITQKNYDLEYRYNSLETAKMLTFDKTEVKGAKKRIDNIVREIDNCIALLNR